MTDSGPRTAARPRLEDASAGISPAFHVHAVRADRPASEVWTVLVAPAAVEGRVNHRRLARHRSLTADGGFAPCAVSMPFRCGSATDLEVLSDSMLNARGRPRRATGAIMTGSSITEAEIAGLAQGHQAADTALFRGAVRSYLRLFVHADDYTLIPPFGGAPRHGFDASEEAVEQLSRFFADGEAQVDVVQFYASGDFVVLVLIERQH